MNPRLGRSEGKQHNNLALSPTQLPHPFSFHRLIHSPTNTKNDNHNHILLSRTTHFTTPVSTTSPYVPHISIYTDTNTFKLCNGVCMERIANFFYARKTKKNGIIWSTDKANTEKNPPVALIFLRFLFLTRGVLFFFFSLLLIAGRMVRYLSCVSQSFPSYRITVVFCCLCSPT